MKLRPKRIVRFTVGLLLVVPYLVLLFVSWVGEQADRAIDKLWEHSDATERWSNRK